MPHSGSLQIRGLERGRRKWAGAGVLSLNPESFAYQPFGCLFHTNGGAV